MPKYDLKCTVKVKGKLLKGEGVELPASIGDNLVKLKKAKASDDGKAAGKKAAAKKDDGNPATGDNGGAGDQGGADGKAAGSAS